MDGSSPSCSQSGDQLSQALPTMEALDLNNNSNNGSHGEVVCDEPPLMTSTIVSATNKSMVNYGHNKSTGAKSFGNGKPVTIGRKGENVMLPGDPETPVAADEVQELPNKVSSSCVDASSLHHQDGGKHRVFNKRPNRNVSHQQDKPASHPIRVTRSTSKLMGTQAAAESIQVRNRQSYHNGQDVSGGDIENTDAGQIKYNKSRGFPATVKATNWTRSEMNRVFTNNGTKCNEHSCRRVNSDVTKGSHVVDHILNDSLLPLHDVTNSDSTGSDATITTATVAKPHAQTRVYDLVAGKKSKKGKRHQPRKTVPVQHKKKLNPSDENETSTLTTMEKLEPSFTNSSTNDTKSKTHVKDTTRLSDNQASGHSRNSRESVCEHKCYLYKACSLLSYCFLTHSTVNRKYQQWLSVVHSSLQT